MITASLLARKTGLQQPHISNFLRNKRRLSLPALDRVLAALGLSAAELFPAPAKADPSPSQGIPITSSQSAMHDEFIRAASVSAYVTLPPAMLAQLHGPQDGRRRVARERFVAIALSAEQAAPMEPRLRPNSIVVLDRHTNMPTGAPDDIFAVEVRGALHLGFLVFEQKHFLLRPHALHYPVELLPVPPAASPADLVVGRVVAVLTRL
ncbi:helix-turn-helix domain-containing protein [Acidipila sp. EB88]|uniref:helix-turn-helix domain-containing protein n=1 Tax=Acidipila sp. EB88 TaxID=2305226 RepID=UPI0013154B58|nr:helix-turn-helix domain-containing protein [Acidipila sp. EB88]